jgi:hypothetical protein
MDLSRIKSTKEKVIIVAPERYPDTAVLTVLAHVEGKMATLQLNRTALELLKVTEGNNRLVMFDQFDVSLTDEPFYVPVIGVVADEKVKGEKAYKTYDIHLKTHCVKSQEIVKMICSLYKIDGITQQDFTIIPTAIDGVFTLDLIQVPNLSEEIEVEVNLNKGEEIEILEQ